ncbi:hypothetical protein Scep_023744 [Stephania cephalantha]|uniref:Uncharacterized protein n=1 Tax=Stephania cephalantha TaxID=152367 RepID=A0AAP0F468_9MAGN
MERQSWSVTLATQLCLCVALFIALNIGGNSERATSDPINTASKKSTRPNDDLYFLSVRGGHRPLNQHSHLLKQATSQFSSLKVPWYNTNASPRPKGTYLLKRIPLRHDQILDIIVVDTKALQALDVNETDQQLSWLTNMLENTDSEWRIAVGFDPLVICEQVEGEKVKEVFEPLLNIFLKFKVNAYLSKQGCADLYTRKASMAYIGNPGPDNEESYKAISSVKSSSLSR